MKKVHLLTAVAALALVGCANDDYVGQAGVSSQENGAIMFQSSKGATTRGDIYGSAAATILGNNFIVEGTKGVLPDEELTTDVVFDNYLVKFGINTAGTTASNTNNWEYVGIGSSDQVTDINALLGRTVDQQTIKYWDYSVPQYDFVAYSTGTAKMVNTTPTSGQVKVTKIGDDRSYTFTGLNADDLSKVYITDVVTVENANYGQPVVLKFKNLTAKVRMAIYETIPGYSVKDVYFYTDDSSLGNAYTHFTGSLPGDQTALDTQNGIAKLYTENGGVYTEYVLYNSGVTAADLYTKDGDPVASTTATLFTPQANPLPQSGEIKVTYPTVGATAKASAPEDYNKARVAVSGVADGKKSTTQEFGTLAAGTMVKKEHNEEASDDKNYIGRHSNEATFAGSLDNNYYQAVIPNTAGQTLTLRVNYTLVSTDGSKETIKVWGAKAIVPATYTKWQPNYAYTYIFKISDNTNGSTDNLGGKEGLYPITFDAVVAQVEDANAEQTTITTVATPSITTYQKGHNYADADSYLASKGDIYVMVKKDGGVLANDLDANGRLYTVAKTSGKAEISEATVTDALLKQVTASPGVNIEGRNGIKLTTASLNHGKTYVGVDGNTVTLEENNTVDNFTPVAGTYAYVYTVTSSTETVNVYQPIATVTGSTPVEGLKSISWATIKAAEDITATETADKDYVYFQVTTNGSGTETHYSYITVVPGKTSVAKAKGVKKIAKSSLATATGTAAAETFYFDTYNENNGEYGVKVIVVE